MAIIGISGYAGSGKDTIGRMIQFLKCKDIEGKVFEDIMKNPLENEWWLEEQSCWQVKKFAGKLKEIASMLTGIPVDLFENQEYKHEELGPRWNYKKIEDGEYFDTPMTVREFLQRLGTDALREGLHPDVWINALMADYERTPDKFVGLTADGFEEWEEGDLPNWVITDCRFPNEAQAIKDAGGIVIRVDRPGCKATNAHVSEKALDNWEFDYKVMNGSDLLSLMFSVHNILKKDK